MVAREGRRMRRVGWLPTLAIAALLAAVPASGLAQEAFTPERQGGIPGALLPDELSLWQYDAESGTYQPVEGDATQPYQPQPRSLGEGAFVGFAEGWAAIPFSAAINRRL